MNKKNLFIVSTLLSLAACESYDVKSTLGLKKPAPDEFMVISNPPLSVPPEFNLQQPDTPVQPSQISIAPQAAAKEQNTKFSNEDENFLKEFDKEHPKTQAKKAVDQDLIDHKKNKTDKGVIRKTISKLNPDGDPIINPVTEKERLQTNAEQGKAINDGEVKMQSKSTLERIFN